jgi:hypothetical protein
LGFFGTDVRQENQIGTGLPITTRWSFNGLQHEDVSAFTPDSAAHEGNEENHLAAIHPNVVSMILNDEDERVEIGAAVVRSDNELANLIFRVAMSSSDVRVEKANVGTSFSGLSASGTAIR